MERKSLLLITACFLAVAFFSCTKQEYTLKQAISDQKNLNSTADSLRRLSGVINYTINIVDGGDAVFTPGWWNYYYEKGGKSVTKFSSVQHARVTASQYGKTVVVNADSVGIATIKDLRVGTVSVQVEADGFTKASFVAQLTPPLDTAGANSSLSAWNLERYAATMIPIFPTTGENQATIKGIVEYESDLTNLAPENPAGVVLLGIIDAEDTYFIDTYILPSNYYGYYFNVTPKDFSFYGNIVKIAYSSAISKATTDASGNYSMTVPATGNGLPIKLEVSDVAVNQKLLMNTVNQLPVFGVQTIRTIFSQDGSPSSIPSVPAAYCTFSAPTGTGNYSQPTVTATAVATVSESGIISVTPGASGSGYTQAPLIRISGTGQGAVATGTITGGRLTDISITSPGIGYTGSPSATVSPSETSTATASAVLGWSISEINVSNPGAGYTSTPAITITSNSGTGASATANMSGYVATLTMTGQGSGYTATPNVTLTGGNGNGATATANMTTANPVQSVYVPANVNLWVNKRLGTRIVGTGSGAVTDSTTLGTLGRVRNVFSITNAGAGYLAAPQVTITGGGGFGAVAHATIAGGVVTGIVLDSQGQNYTSDPSVSISPAPLGGTNAIVANASREFQVTGINVTSNGNGYAAGATVWIEFPPASGIYINATSGYGFTALLNMGVASLNITATGNDFTSAPTVTITPSNGTVSTAATALSSILYKVKSVTVTNQGSGYEGTDYNILIAAPPMGGTQAAASANVMNGVLKRLNLLTPGSGYTASPNVLINGGSPAQFATATATVAGGNVTGFTISGGSGYQSTPTVAIQTYLTSATATVLANSLAGQITSVTVTNAGEGYGSAPIVEFIKDATSNGSGATATAVVTGGRVTDINITAGGNQYYTAPTVVLRMPNYNTLAKADLIISSDGYVTGVTFDDVNNGGYGYTSVPTITVTPSVPGLGSGAVLNAEVKDSRVTKVWVVNRGSGYTGINRPTGSKYFCLTPADWPRTITSKTYIRDIDLGTGRRTIEY